jgi:hypothetical protein
MAACLVHTCVVYEPALLRKKKVNFYNLFKLDANISIVKLLKLKQINF